MADQTRYYGTGKRKNAVARVWILPGDGTITVNKQTPGGYFRRRTLEALVQQPFDATNTVGRYSVLAQTSGGGIAGQAGALRLGIARALNEADNETNRPTLKKAGFLTRDARVKERKKAGLKKARKAPQYSKR